MPVSCMRATCPNELKNIAPTRINPCRRQRARWFAWRWKALRCGIAGRWKSWRNSPAKKFAPIHIIGGGTKNRLLNQFAANATNRTVVTGPVEATAIGNVLMQAIGLGHLGSLADARAVVRASFEVEEYHPAHSSGWDEAYAKLLSLLDSNVFNPRRDLTLECFMVKSLAQTFDSESKR